MTCKYKSYLDGKKSYLDGKKSYLGGKKSYLHGKKSYLFLFSPFYKRSARGSKKYLKIYKNNKKGSFLKKCVDKSEF